MVLISIVIGIGITNLLSGVARAFEVAAKDIRQLGNAKIYFAWVLQSFVWMACFWWYQVALINDITWTLPRYFLELAYAVALFLMTAILSPRANSDTVDFDAYFISQRRWFFLAYLLTTLIDVTETLSNGGFGHLMEIGWVTNIGMLGAVVLAILCIRFPNRKFQFAMSIVLLTWLVASFFETVPALIEAKG